MQSPSTGTFAKLTHNHSHDELVKLIAISLALSPSDCPPPAIAFQLQPVCLIHQRDVLFSQLYLEPTLVSSIITPTPVLMTYFVESD